MDDLNVFCTSTARKGLCRQSMARAQSRITLHEVGAISSFGTGSGGQLESGSVGTGMENKRSSEDEPAEWGRDRRKRKAALKGRAGCSKGRKLFLNRA